MDKVGKESLQYVFYKNIYASVSVFYFIVSFPPVLSNFIIFSVLPGRAKIFCMRYKISMQIYLTKKAATINYLITAFDILWKFVLLTAL